MSNQRRPDDEQIDSVVSEAYGELAQERTPPHLDHVVLNEARKAAKNGRSRAISWLRPAAWVTTIGLCLAIVLEVTDLLPEDDVATDRPVVNGPAESQAERPAARQERPASRAVEDERRPSDGAPAGSPADLPAPAAAEAPQPGLPSGSHENKVTVPVGVESLGRSDTMMLREAEERARAQEGSTREAIRPLPKAMPSADPDAGRYCGEDETATPEAWVECILRLQLDGRHEEARAEHDRLHETFPGAEIPPLTAPLGDSP